MRLENILTDTSDKGLISKIYHEVIKLNTKKKKKPKRKSEQSNLKKGQKAWIDTSPKRTYRWPIDIWKDTQHHYSPEKCKLKPQWDAIPHLSEWLSSINQQTTSASEGMEKGEHLHCWWAISQNVSTLLRILKNFNWWTNISKYLF